MSKKRMTRKSAQEKYVFSSKRPTIEQNPVERTVHGRVGSDFLKSDPYLRGLIENLSNKFQNQSLISIAIETWLRQIRQNRFFY